MDKIQRIFYSNKKCNCGKNGCENNHRLCAICNKKIQWNEYEGNNKDGHKSKCAWNIDHKIPISKGGTNKIENLQAVHIKCNTNKGNNLK